MVKTQSQGGKGDFHIKKLLISLLILFLCAWGIWFAIPESFIASYIKDSPKGQNVDIELIGLKKGLFYTINIERVLLNTQQKLNNPLMPPSPTSAGGNNQSISPPLVGGDKGEGVPLLTIQNMDIDPDPLSILKLTPQININGQVNLGTIRGLITMKQRNPDLYVVGKNIQINGLSIIERTGIYGDGTLNFKFQRADEKGEFTFSIEDAKLKGALPGIGALPLNVFKNVKGLLTIEDTLNVDSLTMEGKGIYVRIKGKIKESNFDGNIEIMVDSSFDLYAVLQAFLERYKISMGYYVIPYTKKI